VLLLSLCYRTIVPGVVDVLLMFVVFLGYMRLCVLHFL